MTEAATLPDGAALVALTQEIEQCETELREEEGRHAGAMARLRSEVREAKAKRAHLAAGVDPEVREDALRLIEVRGEIPRDLDEEVIRRAVEDLAAGCPVLHSEYFGRRHYEGNLHRETYRYGYGPRHGNVVFRIGLTQHAREFLGKWGKLPTGEREEKVHAAIRYLLGLKEAGIA